MKPPLKAGPEESSAGLRTRRDARYNRAVVPWWRRDLSPGGSWTWSATKRKNFTRSRGPGHHSLYGLMSEICVERKAAGTKRAAAH